MVEIAVGYDDQLEVSRLAAGAFEFIFDRTALAGHARVDQCEPSAAGNQVAVDRDIEHKGSGNGRDLWCHFTLRFLWGLKLDFSLQRAGSVASASRGWKCGFSSPKRVLLCPIIQKKYQQGNYSRGRWMLDFRSLGDFGSLLVGLCAAGEKKPG